MAPDDGVSSDLKPSLIVNGKRVQRRRRLMSEDTVARVLFTQGN
jgi:hypothetical protein